MAPPSAKPSAAYELGAVEERQVEHFTVSASLLRQSDELRLDASFFNPAAARALDVVRNSGMRVKRLGDIVKDVFLPPRVKRVYVGADYGVPFLQGSHIVHFQPASVKYVSTSAQKHLDKMIVRAGMILVTRSGTVGRVMLCPKEWDGWAGSEHLLRIVPDEAKCSAAYLYAFLTSPIGYTQLTTPIFGAVVDQLTEDQTKSVLVPIPQTKAQLRQVQDIARRTQEAIELRTKAVTMLSDTVTKIGELLGEDNADAAIAEERIAKA